MLVPGCSIVHYSSTMCPGIVVPSLVLVIAVPDCFYYCVYKPGRPLSL